MSEHLNKIFYQNKVSFNRNRNKKTGTLGSFVRVGKNKGYITSINKKTTTVLIEKNIKKGILKDKKIIVSGRPLVISDGYEDKKSPTNFHRKKRKMVKDQTHNPNRIDFIEGIIVPRANRKTYNWWDCGRWDYKL